MQAQAKRGAQTARAATASATIIRPPDREAQKARAKKVKENIKFSPADAAWRGGALKQSSLPYTSDGKIDYSGIDANPISMVLSGTVRSLLAKAAGRDSEIPGYDGIMELVRQVNDAPGTALELQKRARGVFEGILPAIFIGWIPPLWKQLAPYAPNWAANGAFFLVFYLLFPWLMGPMEGDDFKEVEVPASLRSVFFFLPETVSIPQSVKAERCRFLEASSCASVCVNSCKVPSQEWLTADFGMELHIQPNYDDFSCRWKFGVKAPPLMEDEAIMVPCFTKCPSTYKGTRDLQSREMQIRQEEDDRLAAAVAELSPDGTANSMDSLKSRTSVAQQGGKCWSVSSQRDELREEAVDQIA